MKAYVGYLRPIFYDLCQAEENNYEACASDGANIRQSFPSDHSSLSFVGLTLLSLFLEKMYGLSRYEILTTTSYDHFHPMDDKLQQKPKFGNHSPMVVTTTLQYTRPVGFFRIISILCHTPMCFAMYIAASRVVDNKHFPADVVAGSVLGASIAMFIHKLW